MASHEPPDLLLTNARILRFRGSGGSSDTGFLGVRNGRISVIGPQSGASRWTDLSTRIIDCQGMTLAPGFIDAHCHLLALGYGLGNVDCRPSAVRSVLDIQDAIRARAASTPGDQWIRGRGYQEFHLSEKRHPTRWDLDAVVSDRPVRLDHQSGHGMTLNSRALELIGIGVDTPDPHDGIIQRNEAGVPTGLLLEMAGHVRPYMPKPSPQEAMEALYGASALLLSKGVTSVHDAGPSNGPGRWRLFRQAVNSGRPMPRLTMMPAVSQLKAVEAEMDDDADPVALAHRLSLGTCKLMVTLTTGALQPPVEELRRLVFQAHEQGRQTAFHAVESEVIEAVAKTLVEAQYKFPRRRLRNRIEHCAEAPPHIIDLVRNSGAVVVTNPGFIYGNGGRYIRTTAPDMTPHLYPAGRLRSSGVRVAAGSDAPVTDPNPLISIYSTVTRKTREGEVLGQDQRVGAWEALKMHTLAGAYASFAENDAGSIAVGKMADLVLLDNDPTEIDAEGIKDVRVFKTIVGGETVWES